MLGNVESAVPRGPNEGEVAATVGGMHSLRTVGSVAVSSLSYVLLLAVSVVFSFCGFGENAGTLIRSVPSHYVMYTTVVQVRALDYLFLSCSKLRSNEWWIQVNAYMTLLDIGVFGNCRACA